MEPPATTLPPSPWKKPKIVSLSKTKSMKRKSEMFNASLNNSGANNGSFRFDTNSQELDENSLRDDTDSPRLAKLPKTILNRFSIMNSNSLSNNSFNNSLNESPARNDLYDFFGGNNKDLVLNESSNLDEKSSQKGKDKQSTINSSLITNLYSPAGLTLKKTFTDTYSDLVKKDSNSKDEEQTPKANLYEHSTLLPIDWSLKTRLRFLSIHPFSCNNGIKSQQESEAILNFSKFNKFYENLNAANQQSKDLFKILFGETTNYWTFPYLPWLNLYPRNISVSSFSSEPLSLDIQKNLSKCWNQSFKSLYNSLKSNQCPYFYLLTQSFIVLFRAQNINGMDEMHAILTPSTKGLRETLKDITFTMPLAANQNVNNIAKDQNDSLNNENVTNDASTSNSTKDFSSNKDDPPTTTNTSSDKINCSKDTEKDADDDNDDDEENDDQDNEEIDEFLEKIGLNSAVNFKSSNLQRNNKEAQKDSLLYFDSRPRSTLLFSQGGDVQALFNFLLNSKACILSSGPLTGVPPTLLSPLPFVGAALQKIKVEQNVVKSLTKTGDPLTQYALDFIGPIMPFHVHRLCNLFRATQQNEFDMVANTYEQSSALNCVKNSADLIVDKEQMSKYLDMSEMESLENGYGVFGESTSIKSICIKDDMFCCN